MNKTQNASRRAEIWSNVKTEHGENDFKLTVVSASEGPDGASVFGERDGVRTAAGHLAHVADVFHEHGDVTAVAITVA